jgi:hypothetical protein
MWFNSTLVVLWIFLLSLVTVGSRFLTPLNMFSPDYFARCYVAFILSIGTMFEHILVLLKKSTTRTWTWKKGGNRAGKIDKRVTESMARQWKRKHNVHKLSRENTREHKTLPRNAENATRGCDKRWRLTPRARKHQQACGPWRGCKTPWKEKASQLKKKRPPHRPRRRISRTRRCPRGR